MKTLQINRMKDTPIGEVITVFDGGVLCALDYGDYMIRMHQLLHNRYKAYELIEAQDASGIDAKLAAYFAGDLTALDDIPVTLGGTDFQQQCWLALRDIPAGEMRTYGEQAAMLGRPKASRAVGGANGKNPIALVLPCHRVVGANGKLTGYAGGLWRKEWLLKHEGKQVYKRHHGAGSVSTIKATPELST